MWVDKIGVKQDESRWKRGEGLNLNVWFSIDLEAYLQTENSPGVRW